MIEIDDDYLKINDDSPDIPKDVEKALKEGNCNFWTEYFYSLPGSHQKLFLSRSLKSSVDCPKHMQDFLWDVFEGLSQTDQVAVLNFPLFRKFSKENIKNILEKISEKIKSPYENKILTFDGISLVMQGINYPDTDIQSRAIELLFEFTKNSKIPLIFFERLSSTQIDDPFFTQVVFNLIRHHCSPDMAVSVAFSQDNGADFPPIFHYFSEKQRSMLWEFLRGNWRDDQGLYTLAEKNLHSFDLPYFKEKWQIEKSKQSRKSLTQGFLGQEDKKQTQKERPRKKL